MPSILTESAEFLLKAIETAANPRESVYWKGLDPIAFLVRVQVGAVPYVNTVQGSSSDILRVRAATGLGSVDIGRFGHHSTACQALLLIWRALRHDLAEFDGNHAGVKRVLWEAVRFAVRHCGGLSEGDTCAAIRLAHDMLSRPAAYWDASDGGIDYKVQSADMFPPDNMDLVWRVIGDVENGSLVIYSALQLVADSWQSFPDWLEVLKLDSPRFPIEFPALDALRCEVLTEIRIHEARNGNL